jgi:hypothetical protein
MKRFWVLALVIGCSDAKESKPAPAAAPAPTASAEPSPAAQEKIAQAQAAVDETTAAIKEAQEAAAKAREDAKKEQEKQLARQQAIEAARQNGVLGSLALQQGGTFASLTGTGDISSGFEDDLVGGLIGEEAGEMQGGFGFGRSGFGPGGGGTGAGTIGTGRYGVLGHGAGTSSGYGVGGGRGGLRGRTSAVPQVRIGQPTCTGGDLDKAIVRRYIKRNVQRITYCYEKQLLAVPTLEGTVSTQFTITGNGTVVSASANGVHAEVSACVASVIKAIEFAKPKDGAAVECSYPLTFRPAGG